MKKQEFGIPADLPEKLSNLDNAEKRRDPQKPKILVEVHRVPHLPLPTRYPR